MYAVGQTRRGEANNCEASPRLFQLPCRAALSRRSLSTRRSFTRRLVGVDGSLGEGIRVSASQHFS